MAAVLCKGCSNICSGVCTGLCTGCGKVCSTTCKLCTVPCRILCDICTSPFFCYVAVATAINIPPIAMGVHAVQDVMNCKAGLWLVVNMIFCALHIGAACYFALTIRNRKDEEFQSRTTSLGRAGYLLCYDPVIAAYILVILGFFCWLCVGVTWRLEKEMDEDDVCGNKMEKEYTKAALGCGFGFFAGGFFAFMLSLCCSACDRSYYTDDTVYHVADPNNPKPPSTTQNQHQSQPQTTSRPTSTASASKTYGTNSTYVPDEEASIPVATPVQQPVNARAVPTSSTTTQNDDERSTLEDYGARAGKALNDLISKVGTKK